MLADYIDKIVAGDCIQVLKNIEDNSVDVCFADPPFNLGKKYLAYNDSKPQKEYIDWCSLWLKELVRVTKPTGSIFVHNIPKWLIYYANILNEIAYFQHWIVWDSLAGLGNKTLLPSHYGILFYTKSKSGFKIYRVRYPHKRCRKCHVLLKNYSGHLDKLHPYGPLISDVWSDITRERYCRDKHPCQLPIYLLERILLLSTDPSDVVLDPFIGTGTTAIAAKKLGRHYVGIDISPQYVEIATSKLEKTYKSVFAEVYVSYRSGKVYDIRDIDIPKFFEGVD